LKPFLRVPGRNEQRGKEAGKTGQVADVVVEQTQGKRYIEIFGLPVFGLFQILPGILGPPEGGEIVFAGDVPADFDQLGHSYGEKGICVLGVFFEAPFSFGERLSDELQHELLLPLPLLFVKAHLIEEKVGQGQ